MRRWLWTMAAGALAAGAAGAATLPVAGQLEIRIEKPGGGFIAIGVGGTGAALASGTGAQLTGLALPAGLFATTALSVPVTDPSAAPFRGQVLTVMNAAGSFAATGGHLGGVMPLIGVERLCLFAPCSTPPPANLFVPLRVVGAGGLATRPGAIGPTVAGAPWTTGTAMLPIGAGMTHTLMGFAHGPASATSSAGQASGVVQLVTPIVIDTGLPSEPTLAYGVLTLHFVPEPGAACLLLLGVTAMALHGRSRWT